MIEKNSPLVTHTSKIKPRFRILARHYNWVFGETITESIQRGETFEDESIRRFTATIRKWQGWKIYQGPTGPDVISYVIATVRAIRDRIDAGDEAVFNEPNEYATKEAAEEAASK